VIKELLRVILGMVIVQFIICPIPIAQHGTDYKIAFVVLSICLLVYLSVRALTLAFFVRFRRKFAQKLGARKNAFARVKI